MINKLIAIFLLASASSALAAATTKPKSVASVLDFSTDVTEGEMIRPRLFLELSSKVDFMESSLYVREDFNDFHMIDSKSRLRYIDPKGAK